MSKQLMFRSETLKAVMMDVKTNGSGLWLVGAEGIYLTAQKPSYIGAKRTIAYAEGFDLERWDDIGELFVAMDEATGIEGEIIEGLTVDAQMLELLTTCVADLAVKINDGKFSLAVQLRYRSQKGGLDE